MSNKVVSFEEWDCYGITNVEVTYDNNEKDSFLKSSILHKTESIELSVEVIQRYIDEHVYLTMIGGVPNEG